MPARFLNFQRTTVHHEKSSLPCLDLLSYLLSENGIFSVTAQVPRHSCFSREKNECPKCQAVFRYVHILPNFHLTISLPSPPTMPRVIQPGGGGGKMWVRYRAQVAWPRCRLEAYAGGGYVVACHRIRLRVNPPAKKIDHNPLIKRSRNTIPRPFQPKPSCTTFDCHVFRD